MADNVITNTPWGNFSTDNEEFESHISNIDKFVDIIVKLIDKDFFEITTVSTGNILAQMQIASFKSNSDLNFDMRITDSATIDFGDLGNFKLESKHYERIYAAHNQYLLRKEKIAIDAALVIAYGALGVEEQE